jgi:hypothetical protein
MKKIQQEAGLKEIIVVSATPPIQPLFFNGSRDLDDGLDTALLFDVNKRVRTWCHGGVNFPTDITLSGIRYVSNPLRLHNYFPLVV